MPADVGRRSVSPEGEFTLGTSTVTETSSAGDVTPRPLQSGRFQVKIGDEWKDSEASEDKLLKQLLRDGHEVVKITLRGQRLEYDFRALEQRNITRGTVRPIRLPKDWVDMEEWAEDRRALAQPGGPRSGAAAPPPTPRAMSPSAARLSSAPQSPHAPRTPPLESGSVREASRPRARSPADSPYHDLMRLPATSPRRRRPTREAVSHMEEQQQHKKRTSGVPCTPDRRPSTARQMSFSARAPEVNSSRRAKDGRLSARVAELEEILRTTKESGEHFASLSLTQLHQLTARTQQLEEHLRTAKEGGSQKSSSGKRPKQKPPDKGSQGARAPGIRSSSDCLGAEAPGRPARSDEQDQATSTSSSSFATSDSDEPTQRNASQAGLMAMVLKLEAQLAASRAENEQLCEIISRTTSGAGIAPQEGKEEERQDEDLSETLRLQASPASRSSEARVAAPPQAPSTPPGRASSPDLCALGTPQRSRLPSGATPLRLPRMPPCAATTPPKARPRCSSLWGSPGRSPVGGVATPVRRASFFSCLQTPEHGGCADGFPGELGRPSCQSHNSRSSLGRIYLPAWRGHYLSLPRTLKNSFDEVAEDAEVAAKKNACPLDGAPVPPLGESWDWPLSRQERKERATFLDRQVLMADQRSLMQHIEGIRKGSRSTRGSTQAPVPSLVLSPSLDTDLWED